MQGENMQTVGAYLKKNRELKGISIEEIASNTKININILSYLESDKFDKLPAPVFVKGFIKTYLKYLGLDAKEAILFYELITSEAKPVEDKINTLTQKDVCSSKEKINKRVLITSIAISVAFASMLTYSLSTNRSSDKSKDMMIVKMIKDNNQQPVQPQGIVPVQGQPQTLAQGSTTQTTATTTTATTQPATTPTPALATPTVTATAMTSPKPVQNPTVATTPQAITTPAVKPTQVVQTATPATPIIRTQQVTIRARKDVWLKVQIDDTNSFDFLLRAGNTKKLEAKTEIKLLIGDASAVAVDYEGKTMTDLGREGNTKSIVFPGLGRWKGAML